MHDFFLVNLGLQPPTERTRSCSVLIPDSIRVIQARETKRSSSESCSRINYRGTAGKLEMLICVSSPTSPRPPSPESHRDSHERLSEKKKVRKEKKINPGNDLMKCGLVGKINSQNKEITVLLFPLKDRTKGKR